MKDNVTRGVKRNVRSVKATDLPITKSIMAINIAIFIMTEFVSKPFATLSQENLALNAVFLHEGEWWRLVTAGFLHFGLFHIAMNMAILYQLGETFERSLGPWRYIALYAACLLGGSAGSVLLDPVFAKAGGASGAVFGLAGAAVVALRQRGVSFNNTQWGPLLLINLVITFVVPGISKGGHLGGLAIGLTAGVIILHPRRRGRSLPQDLLILLALGALAVGAAYFFIGLRSAAIDDFIRQFG